MCTRKWWVDQDNLKCTYNEFYYCEQYPTCNMCPLYPKNKEIQSKQSNTLESKQITIEEIINGTNK